MTIAKQKTENSMPELPAWLEKFTALRDEDDPVWLDVARRAKEVTLPADYEVFHEGDHCRNYIFVINGATRVFKAFESGREMVLYRLQAGETCSLTTSVLLAGGLYPANAKTEAETHAVLVPERDFHRAFDSSKVFRDYVCTVFGGRIRDMIMLLEAVTMRNVEVRLARWLIDNRTISDSVEASHRELAYELGTAREVISRYLKDFENKGWVSLSRKYVGLTDVDALNEIVSGTRS
jgi:CRP/FNR family transcriptional regulator